MKRIFAFIRVDCRVFVVDDRVWGNLRLGPQQDAAFPPIAERSLLSSRNQPLQYAMTYLACGLHIATHIQLRTFNERCRNSLCVMVLRLFLWHSSLLGTSIA
jgi:hypothetical protein